MTNNLSNDNADILTWKSYNICRFQFNGYLPYLKDIFTIFSPYISRGYSPKSTGLAI
jgi:hypothetical protein